MSTTTELPDVKAYEDMTPQELRVELARLDDVCIRQNLELQQLQEATHTLIQEFGDILMAHVKQDAAGLRAKLAAAVEKHVMVVPADGAMH